MNCLSGQVTTVCVCVHGFSRWSSCWWPGGYMCIGQLVQMRELMVLRSRVRGYWCAEGACTV